MSEREENAIRAILLGANHFEVLKLSKPYPDLMGEPLWDVKPENVNRAFRKLSLHCHPDKSKHPDAPRAFELLKKAKRVLQSELESETYIRNFIREQKTNWEGMWSTAEETANAKVLSKPTSRQHPLRRSGPRVCTRHVHAGWHQGMAQARNLSARIAASSHCCHVVCAAGARFVDA